MFFVSFLGDQKTWRPPFLGFGGHDRVAPLIRQWIQGGGGAPGSGAHPLRHGAPWRHRTGSRKCFS